ncbi:MAG: nucleotide exchange factor GrpE [Cyanobacteria bacterium]|nr:nucleotide exchange factor GrpE [Cyanobacteriota bacterium]
MDSQQTHTHNDQPVDATSQAVLDENPGSSEDGPSEEAPTGGQTPPFNSASLELETKLKDLEKDYKEKNEQYLRLAADFDNYRKRSFQEQESARKSGTESALQELLSVLDNLDRASSSLTENSDPKVLFQSFNLMNRQLLEAFGNLGVKKMETVGKPFDPIFHEAVSQIETEEALDQTILKELQAGFMLYDKVLRPAMVTVALNSSGAVTPNDANGSNANNPFKGAGTSGNFKPE